MSYSFTVRADTKDEAKAKIATEFDTVLAAQPIHAADRAAAEASAASFVDLLADDPTQRISVSVSGSVVARSETEFTVAGVSIAASLFVGAKGGHVDN